MGCSQPTTPASKTEDLAANEIFYRSPLPEDRRPREEVIVAYLSHVSNSNDTETEWAMTTLTGMTFYTPPDQQWDFIVELIQRAPDDDDVLQDIAAGPLEGFLGRFSDEVIDRIEQQSTVDPKFARVLSGVWKHGMSDGTWQRVRAIQRTVERPLPEMEPFE